MKKITQPITTGILGLLMAGTIGSSFAQSIEHMQNTVEPPPYHKYHGVSNEQVKVIHGIVKKHLNNNDFIIKDIDRKSNRFGRQIYEVEIIRLPENRKNGITLEYELLIDYTNKTVISDKIDS